MSSDQSDQAGNSGETLLTMRGIRIEGQAEDGWKEIVHGLDVELKRGEIIGLIGESGAGKSTLGLAAMAYSRDGCRISAGEIVFDGMDLLTMSESKMRDLRGVRIAYVAQSAAASFNPAHQLVTQFAEGPVQHGIKNFGEAAEDAKQIYRRLDLPDPDNIGLRYPHQVSGGQLQRAMIAMAMSCRPDLIVFDEPTTALDVTTQIEVLAAIRDVVSQAGMAAIYITHDLAVVAQLADRIMVLRYGNLVEEGNARELLANPKEEYTRQLLRARSGRKEASGDVSDTVLRVNGVSARYGTGPLVLDNVSITVPRGKTVAVVGESGSGKSTLARAITGLLPPFAGDIIFDEAVMTPALKARTRDDLRRLQMIYQMPDIALNPRQRIRDAIGRPLDFYLGMKSRDREKRIHELLEMIELPGNYIDRYPSELSGGEKQRVCIARALAAEPELIICDEVTSALDQVVSDGILKLLQTLQSDLNVSYLFITHDLATVKAIADRIVVMLQGRVVEEGEREEILTPPHHDYTDLLLSSVPEMDPDWLDRLLAARKAAQNTQSA